MNWTECKTADVRSRGVQYRLALTPKGEVVAGRVWADGRQGWQVLTVDQAVEVACRPDVERQIPLPESVKDWPDTAIHEAIERYGIMMESGVIDARRLAVEDTRKQYGRSR